MTSTIFYKGKQYNGIFVSKFSGYHDIYIDRQERLAILIDHLNKVRAVVKLESYNIDVLLDDEDDKFIEELKNLKNKFENEMYNE